MSSPWSRIQTNEKVQGRGKVSVQGRKWPRKSRTGTGRQVLGNCIQFSIVGTLVRDVKLEELSWKK